MYKINLFIRKIKIKCLHYLFILNFILFPSLMLKNNYQQNPQQQKLIDALLKHKVRNLRAKVQSLLPIHLCSKNQRRSKHLEKLIMKKYLIQQQQSTQQFSSIDSTYRLEKGWKYAFGQIKKENSFAFFSTPSQNQQMNVSQSRSKHQHESNHNNNFSLEDPQIRRKKVDRKKSNLMQIRAKGYRFQKLTQQQIEQIGEDKLYYLGQEEHVQAYESYIKQKSRAKVTTPITDAVYKAMSKPIIPLGTFKATHQKLHTNISIDDQDYEKRYPSSTALEQILNRARKESLLLDQVKQQKNASLSESKNLTNGTKYMRNTSNEKSTSLWKHNEYLTRKNEDSHLQRILLSMEMKTKQFKVEQNFINIKKNKIETIQKQNLKKQQKIITAQEKKRKIHTEAGQVVQLAQKLRRKCLQRGAFNFNDRQKPSTLLHRINQAVS